MFGFPLRGTAIFNVGATEVAVAYFNNFDIYRL
jgi:hypothetical protein